MAITTTLRHPPLQPGWIDAPHRIATFGTFALESGETLDELVLSYVVHGDLDDRTKPIVLGLCAIGSTHHRLDFLIGPGRALDPVHCTIVVIDAIGNGLSSSPSNARTQPRARFPRFTLRDMVHSQKRLCEQLGIDSLFAVIGASMGGMQALQWGVSYPGFMQRLVALTPMAKTAPWAQAINHAGRLALETGQGSWDLWIAIMQVFAMRTPARFAADVDCSTAAEWLQARAAWWNTQQCDPLDWIYQSLAYDAHDVGTTPGYDGDTARALSAIKAKTLVVVADIDLYNPVEAGAWAAAHIAGATTLRLPYASGHLMASEADPDAAARLNVEIGQFLG